MDDLFLLLNDIVNDYKEQEEKTLTMIDKLKEKQNEILTKR